MNIELKNVSKDIQQVKIIENVSLTLKGGTIYGLYGCNGSGKTMLMRLICGLIKATSGEVMVDGKTVGKEFDFVPNTGLLIENPAFLNDYTGFQNLKFLAELNNKVNDYEIYDILDKVGLKERAKKVRKYSLGMKQRLGIAAAIMEHPDLLILDEPSNALDTSGVEVLKNILKAEKERGAIIVISCHERQFLEEMSDVLIHIENGRIVNITGEYHEKA